RELDAPRRNGDRRAPEEVLAHAAHLALRPDLNRIRGARPLGVALAPDAVATPVVVGLLPGGPVSADPAGAKRRRHGALPVEPDEIEPRSRTLKLAAAVERNVANDHAHRRRVRDSGRDAQSHGNEKNELQLQPTSPSSPCQSDPAQASLLLESLQP